MCMKHTVNFWKLSFDFIVKEGLLRLSCLLPFDIITLDLWTQIAPHWMITIGNKKQHINKI